MNKILLTANTSWYLYNFRKGTIKALIDAGYSVYTLSPDNKCVDKLVELGAYHSIVYMDIHSKSPIKDIKTFCSYIKSYRAIQPDLVLNFTPKSNIYSTLAAKQLKIKVINNISGLGKIFILGGISNKIATFLYKISQPSASHIFFQNNEDMNLFLKKGIVDASKISRLPGSGVNLEQFALSELPKGQDKFVLFARMIREKGVEIFALAAQKIKKCYPDVEFVLMGEVVKNSPSGVSIEELCEWEHQGIIKYFERTDNVEEVIKQYTAVVLPSYYREGTPRSLLEAGASGRPIITTDNVGCRDTVIDGISGFLCQPKDVDSLVDVLLKFIQLPREEKEKMGKSGRAFIEKKFDEKIVINKYFEKIRELLDKKK